MLNLNYKLYSRPSSPRLEGTALGGYRHDGTMSGLQRICSLWYHGIGFCPMERLLHLLTSRMAAAAFRVPDFEPCLDDVTISPLGRSPDASFKAENGLEQV